VGESVFIYTILRGSALFSGHFRRGRASALVGLLMTNGRKIGPIFSFYFWALLVFLGGRCVVGLPPLLSSPPPFFIPAKLSA